MARLRIVELPMTGTGEDVATPFVVVLDQIEQSSPFYSREGVARFGATAQAWGARGALVTTDTVELADELPLAEPLALVDSGGHRFGGPGFDDPLRCSRCGIERVDWVTRRVPPACGEVGRTRGVG